VPSGFVNTRERLLEKARPLLEPGEAVAHVVRAQEGKNRYLAMLFALVGGAGLAVVAGAPALAFPLGYLVFTLQYRRRLILATDRALVVLAGGWFRYTPQKVIERLDLETPIGPLRGLQMETRIGDHRMFVMPRTAPEARAADDDLDAG
jgi:hypothetical protein